VRPRVPRLADGQDPLSSGTSPQTLGSFLRAWTSLRGSAGSPVAHVSCDIERTKHWNYLISEHWSSGGPSDSSSSSGSSGSRGPAVPAVLEVPAVL